MSGRSTRRYPPLVAVVGTIVLLLFVLPSALNLPQTNPATTLEYAPVPPEDDVPPDAPPGNLSALGLSTGDGLAVATPPPPPPPDAAGEGKNPRTKKCVGTPLRQTEDPLSPPCVAYFEGDNGGATYQGVTKDEIRILLIREVTAPPTTSRGPEVEPSDALFDLGRPPQPGETTGVAVARLFQRYFNDRYQTYNRRAHFWVFFADDDAPEARRADAAQLYDAVKPFAVISSITGNEDVFIGEMAKRGVLVFGSRVGIDASFYRRFAPKIWGYYPSIQVQAKQFSSWVCSKVVNKPVSFSGNGDIGQPRRLGLLRTNNPDYPGMIEFAALVKQQIQACGGNFVSEATFPVVGGSPSPRQRLDPYASRNMAQFKQAGVTTVIWAQGLETDQSRAAKDAGYYPEWIAAGDGAIDGFGGMSVTGEQSTWRHAMVLTNVPLEPPPGETSCVRALQEADPRVPLVDAKYQCRFSGMYLSGRHLFSGIQVAGPNLTPAAIDEGFHAIPPVESNDPAIPACYYPPGDYTCVKDAAAMWWDDTATNGDGGTGCWRMAEGGRRHVTGKWPKGNVNAQNRPNDPCNGFVGQWSFFVV